MNRNTQDGPRQREQRGTGRRSRLRPSLSAATRASSSFTLATVLGGEQRLDLFF